MFAQDISGQWNGILKIQGMQLRLVFNITSTEKGYSATMDSPDQGVNGIPVTEIQFENGTLNLNVSNAGIQYEGTLNDGNIFEGTFKQGGQSIPLELTMDEVKAEKMKRPQEPTPPYPYYSEDVKFKNKKAGITLAGTLTSPAKKGNFPAVILISGSGPQNRDEEIMGHKPFLVLSDFLTRNGFAVLRFDDRGTAQSTGDFESATTFNFAEDVASAVRYLKKRKEIDHSKIGLIGHSEGGIIAPIVAANSDDVNFIVLLAGTGIRGDRLLMLQQELIGRARGMSETDLEKTKKVSKGAFDLILQIEDTDSLKLQLTHYLRQTLGDYPANTLPEGMTEAAFIDNQVTQLTSPWMYNFIKYNPSLILEEVSCPVLAINGEKDLQVASAINLEAIEKALEKGGNQQVTTKELANLNHLFQESETGSPDEYAEIEQTFSPMALDTVLNWLKKVIQEE
jgi:pimeloyl-ACP methyl ester carboxylesterase